MVFPLLFEYFSYTTEWQQKRIKTDQPIIPICYHLSPITKGNSVVNISNLTDLFVANGVNGSTGNYGLEPISPADLTKIIAREGLQGKLDPDNYDQLEAHNQKSILMQAILRERLVELQAEKSKLNAAHDAARLAQIEREIKRIEGAITDHLGAAEGIDTGNIAETGWGVIFANDADPAIEEALNPLLSLRRDQATPKNDRFYRVFKGGEGYQKGETSLAFTSRHGVGPGPVDPAKGIPYYLLIVGSPSDIPYQFQYQLDVQFAVGRIYFETLEEYGDYANNVVAAETGQVKLPRRATFFGPANQQDPATQMSLNHLITPLHNALQTKQPDWQIDLLTAEQATKSQLATLLNNANAPALLFTASHGMEFAMDDSRQVQHQGALLCQDWPGPRRWRKPVPTDFYFSGDDLESSSNLLGSISFHFACYGAGTPAFDEFAGFQAQQKRIAAAPFMANLPTRLLNQGALAVVGHVERAWGYSFFWPNAGEQLTVFDSTLKRLMTGLPVGSAVEYFNERYAELATVFSAELDRAETNPTTQLPSIWTAHNDARNYIIIGDPAVRLPLAASGEAEISRPAVGTPNFAAGTEPASTEPNPSTAFSPIRQISNEDWQNTPSKVRQLLQKLKALLS